MGAPTACGRRNWRARGGTRKRWPTGSWPSCSISSGAGPGGSRATYDVLAGLGVPVERRRRPLFGLAREGARRPGLLVVLDPPLDLQAVEIAEVVRYVRGGGAVLAAGDGGGIAACAGW